MMKSIKIKRFTKVLAYSFAVMLLLQLPYQAEAQRRDDRRRGAKPKKRVVVARPHTRYNHLPRRATRVTVVPAGYRTIVYAGINYRYYNGVFYRPMGNQFIVSAAPVGIRISVLPPGYFTLRVGRRPYFYYYGAYYVQVPNGGYESVAPPVGARVDALPDGYEIVELDGMTYYLSDGTYYRATIGPQGDALYEVVDTNTSYNAKPSALPIGTRVEALPPKAEKVMLDNMTYYMADGVYYKAVIGPQGEVMYEVVGR